jgi:hypothetical protein
MNFKGNSWSCIGVPSTVNAAGVPDFDWKISGDVRLFVAV